MGDHQPKTEHAGAATDPSSVVCPPSSASRPLSSVSRPLDAPAAALAVLLCLSWGFNQVAIKLAITDIPPLTQAALRSIVGALIVVAWAASRGVRLAGRDGTLMPGLAAGLLFGLEFILIFQALAWTDASRASLFIYTAPFFVVIGSRWLLPGDRFDLLQWLGLLLSFAGIALAFGLPAPGADVYALLGDLMLVGAGAAWGATTLVIKASKLAAASYEKTLLYQLVVSAPMMALAAWLAGERVAALPSALALGSLAYQTLWVTGFTYLAWFALVLRYSASRLSVFTFLTPLFGVAAGHLVLGEPLTPAFAAAAALVVAGLVLVNRPR
jgi:drug/metabolite transporter (DMT)-like permease